MEKTIVTAKDNGWVWRVFAENEPEIDVPIAEVSNLPVPSVGDRLYCEEYYSGNLTVTQVTWNIRKGYPLEIDVWVRKL